ncbi:heat shock protein 70 family [Syncephalis fuscata]|nr:heat shock protein 70 family [Syncephalis fuscata]
MADTSTLNNANGVDGSTNVVGIHLGTLRASVAVLDKDGRPQLVANEDGDRMVPAYVAFSGTEELVGVQARQLSVRQPNRVTLAFNELLGYPAVDAFRGHGNRVALTEEDGQLKFEVPAEEQWDDDGEPIEAAGPTYYSPEQVTAIVLRQLRSSAESALGQSVSGAVLAYPAHFSPTQRAGLCKAAQLAGLAVYQVVSEPAAAQLAFDASVNRPTAASTDINRIIIDLGGTALRVHAYGVRGGLYSRLVSRNETGLGGRALDCALAAHLQREFTRRHRIDLSDRPRSVAKLVLACEATRRSLGMRPSAPCSVESIADGIDLNINVHRAVFDSAVAPLVQRCMDIVNEVLALVGWSKDGANGTQKPHEILLLGGASRLPLLHTQLNKLFAATSEEQDKTNDQVIIRTEVEPDEAAALGCAIQAALLANTSAYASDDYACLPGTSTVPHLSQAIGIIDAADRFETIIPAGTPLPVKRHRLIERSAEHCRVRLYERSNTGETRAIAQLTLADLGLPTDENQRVYLDVTIRESGATQLVLRCPHSNKRIQGELPAVSAEVSVLST